MEDVPVIPVPEDEDEDDVDVCCGGDGAPTEGYPVGSGTFLLRNAAPRHWDVTVPIGCDWGASKMAEDDADEDDDDVPVLDDVPYEIAIPVST